MLFWWWRMLTVFFFYFWQAIFSEECSLFFFLSIMQQRYYSTIISDKTLLSVSCIFFRVLSCSNDEDNSCFRNWLLLGGSREMHNQIQWSNQSKEAFHGHGWLECTHGPGNEIPKPNSKWKSSLHTSVTNRRTFASRSRTFSYASESDRPPCMHLESWHWIMPCHLLFHPWCEARVFVYICISFVYSPENARSCQFYPLIPHYWIVSLSQPKNYCNIVGDLMTVLSTCPAKWISFLYAEMSYLCWVRSCIECWWNSSKVLQFVKNIGYCQNCNEVVLQKMLGV